MTKPERVLAVLVFAMIYILGIVRPDILTAWEVPALLVFAGIYGLVLARQGSGERKGT